MRPITDAELANMCGTTVYEIERGRERDAAAKERRHRRNAKRARDALRTKEGRK